MTRKNSTASFLKNRDDWIRSVINNDELDHSVARVAVHIAMRMRNDQQFCWPSIDKISKETGVSPRGVSNALNILCGGVDRKTGVEYETFLIRQSRPNVGNVYSLFFRWL